MKILQSFNEPVELALIIILGVIALIFAGLSIFFGFHFFKNKNAKRESEKMIKDAEIKADKIVKNAQLDAKQQAHEYKMEVEAELKNRRNELNDDYNKLSSRESSLDKRDQILLEKEKNIENKQNMLELKILDYDKKDKKLQAKLDEIISELENISKMSVAEAKQEIMNKVETKLQNEITLYMKNKEEEAIEEADKKAKDILTLTMSRLAQETTIEHTIATIHLPNDELKGRIIGREGRNIKSLETTLGVDLIVDDTPEVITVSCFNPLRREIAVRTLEALIKDGRIQPQRIEELYKKNTDEVNKIIHQAGQDAAFKLGLSKINHELLDIMGRLKFRTSYGQNQLQHCIECGLMCGMMAAELGLDQQLAKRAGFLHDLGKAMDFEIEGSHVEIGARLAKKYGENDIIINAIECHHGEKEPKSLIANLVITADTLSSARPGARSETFETYVKRVEQLETISKSFDGVLQAFAVQAGREVRVMVIPDKIDDNGSYILAKKIKEKIENEMAYPGTIKVNVIREFRATETAK